MITEPTSPIGTLRLGFLLSSASGPVDSHPLKAKMENTTPRNRLPARLKLPGLSGPQLNPPGPGDASPLKASATMITISISPVMISAFSEMEIPWKAKKITSATPASTQIHHGMSTPYSALIDGSRTDLARNDMVSVATGGSQIENSTPAKKPARGCKARAIQVYQPPADGNTFASWAADKACSPSRTPPNRNAHGVTRPANPTMNTKDARIANDGPMVAMPCMSIPGRLTAFSRSSVLMLPLLDCPASIATASLLPVAHREQDH